MLLLSALWWLRLSKRLDGRLWWWVELTVAVCLFVFKQTEIVLSTLSLSILILLKAIIKIKIFYKTVFSLKNSDTSS